MSLVSYVASQADVVVFKAISEAPSAETYPNVARWFTHIKSYTAEFDSLSGSSSAGEAFLGAAAAPAAAEEDDDEVDLFGSDEEEDAEAERIKAERLAAYNAKKAAKPKTIAKVRAMSPYCFMRSCICYLSLICTYGFEQYAYCNYSVLLTVRCDARGQALGR